MELEFRQVQIPYLHCISYETLTQEERGETAVPDGMPDMEHIDGCCAAAVVRSRQAEDGELRVSGDVQACVLYSAAGEDRPRLLNLYLPFTMRRPVPAEDCRTALTCRVRRADAQMLGSRKVGVRVVLAFTLRVWCESEQTCFRPAGSDRRIQLKYDEFPMRLTRECAEKAVLLRDVLPPDTALAEGARIVHASARCEITDEKLSGSEAVCKGLLRVGALCQSPDGAIGGCELSIPFSQLIDLEGRYDGQSVEIVPVLTALETMAENGNVSVEAGISLQCIVTQTVNVPLAEDAYALRGTLRTQTGEVDLQPLLDSRTLRQDCALELPVQANEILRAEAVPDAAQVEWIGGTCRVRVPVAVRVLDRDPKGLCRQAEGSTELRQELSAEPSLCRAEGQIEGPVFAVPGAGRIELRIPVAAHCQWYDSSTRRSIVAAELTEGPREERPAVVIRTLQTDVPLWDVAKELRTTVSAIQIANDMDADTAPAGTMLLIPIVA